MNQHEVINGTGLQGDGEGRHPIARGGGHDGLRAPIRPEDRGRRSGPADANRILIGICVGELSIHVDDAVRRI